MKRIVLSLIAAATAFSSLAGELSEKMSNFREGALILIEGIANADKYALTDASELLEKANPEELDNVSFSESRTGALTDPLVLFTSGFCDTLRKNNFTLVPLNPLEQLRQIQGDVITVTRSLAPGAEAVFSFEGADSMQLVTACTTPSALQTVITAEAGEIAPAADAEGFTSQAVWNLPSDGASFSITVKNPTDKPLSFVIALQ